MTPVVFINDGQETLSITQQRQHQTDEGLIAGLIVQLDTAEEKLEAVGYFCGKGK
jgi:hypothetical protein